MTPYDLLLRYPDSTRPLVTYYGGSDVRVELSVASTVNAVAKASSMLRDGLGLAPGAVVSVDLPRHWQLPVWVLAALSVGAQVGRDVPGVVDVRIVGPQGLAAPAAAGADEVLASSCDAFGLPIPGGVPLGVTDIAAEVRGYPDSFTPDPGSAAAAVLVAGGADPWAQRRTGVADGARIWVDESTAEDHLLDLVAIQPVLARGSVVIGTGLGPERTAAICRTESATPAP